MGRGSRGQVRSVFPHGGDLIHPPLTGLSALFVISSVMSPIVGAFGVSGVATLTRCGGVGPIVIFAGASLRPGCSRCRGVCGGTKFSICYYGPSRPNNTRRVGSLLTNGYSTFANGANINGSALLGTVRIKLRLPANRADGGLNEKERAAHRYRLFGIYNNCITSAPNFSSVSFRHYLDVSGSRLFSYFERFRPCFKGYGFSAYARAIRGNYTIYRTMGGKLVSRDERGDCIGVCGSLGGIGR